MAGEMETFWESVKLMLFVYALAAVVAFAMAGVITLIHAGIRKNRVRATRAEARREARAKTAAGPGNPTPGRTD